MKDEKQLVFSYFLPKNAPKSHKSGFLGFSQKFTLAQ